MNPDTAPATPDLAARRERLALLCALDRVSLRLVLRPPVPSSPSTFASAASAASASLGNAADLASLFPGRIGRWSRRIAFGLRLARGVGRP